MGLALLAIAAGLSFLLSGCGPGTPAPEATTSPTVAAAGEPRFDLQAHRGGRGVRPENTLPAFEYALDLQVTTLELDLHLTRDGEVVVTHDDAVGRNCRLDPAATPPLPPDPQARDVRAEDLQISRLTLEQIKKYRCDLNPEPGRFPDQSAPAMPLAGAGYGIPTLAELFQFTLDYAASDLKTEAQREQARRVRFNVETKRTPGRPELIGDDFDGQTPGRFERRIVDLVEQFDLAGRVTIQSFDHRSINVIPQLNPAIQTVALTSRPVDPARLARETSAAVWSPSHGSLTAKAIRAAHEAGLLVIPWTVNDAARMEALIDLGVDGLITDYPERLRGILDERGIVY